MNVRSPDYTEHRGESVLLVWGDLPYWTIVDRPAARFIEAIATGHSPADALDACGGGRDMERDAAHIIVSLKRAGVIGNRRIGLPRERIESISVNVTNRCNLKCAFCYNAGRDIPKDELNAEQMIAAFESVRRFTVKGAMLALFGGEPLLEKEKTLALASWAKRRRMNVIVSSNGLLVDADFARRAAEIGFDCQVSIDGATAASHDAIRGAGTFERALAGVRQFVDAGAHTMISMVFHDGNIDEIPDYLRMASRLGVDEARFIPLKKLGGGGDFETPDLAAAIRLIAALLDEEPELGRLLGRDFVSILAGTCRDCSRRQTCGTGSQTFLLDADGSVYPCINLACPEMCAGSVLMEPLRSIWVKSDVFQRVRKDVRLENRIGACTECFARYWCMGGCRGEAYANTGRLDVPSVSCAENRRAIIETFWTVAQHPELVRVGQKYC